MATTSSETQQDPVTQAVAAAKYNEIVVIQHADGENSSLETVLSCRLDSVNGGVIWTPLHRSSTQNDDDNEETRTRLIKRHVRTKKWILPMLNDSRRNDLYERAISEACQCAFKNKETNFIRPWRVLDIGSGTGLLAMLTAKHFRKLLDNKTENIASSETLHESVKSKAVEIVSVEMSRVMASLAHEVVERNQMQDIIHVMEAHSCHQTFHPFPNDKNYGKANLCISELLESGLLGEGILPTLRDAHARHLEPNSTIIPRGARVYAQLIHGGEAVSQFRGPRSFQPCSSQDEDKTIHFTLTNSHSDTFSKGGFHVPLHARALYKLPSVHVLSSSQPVEVFDFDFSTAAALPPPTGRSNTIQVPIEKSGVVNGVVYWWELDLWDGITYSTTPPTNCSLQNEKVGETPSSFSSWQDHWHQCLYVLTLEQDCTVEKGGACLLTAFHDDERLSFRVRAVSKSDATACDDENKNETDKRTIEKENDSPCPTLKKPKIESMLIRHPTPPHCSPQRTLQLNNQHRLSILHNAISSALKHLNTAKASVLDVSDGSLCAMIAAKCCGAQYVTSIESSTTNGNIPLLTARMAQLGNGLCRMDRFQIVNGLPECVTLDHLLLAPLSTPSASLSPSRNDTDAVSTKRRVDLVVAEPYYHVLETHHLLEALNLFYTVRSLRQRGVIAPHAIYFPRSFSMYACAIQSPELASAYANVDENLCGLNHEDVFQEMGGAFTESDLCLEMWQYEHEVLSQVVQVARVDYGHDDGLGSCNSGWRKGKFEKGGTCHAMMFWVEYDFESSSRSSSRYNQDENCGGDDDGGRDSRTISTNNRYHCQLVRMNNAPTEVLDRELEDTWFCVQAFLGVDAVGKGGFEEADYQLLFKVERRKSTPRTDRKGV